MGVGTRIVTLYTKGATNAMLIFVRMQNCVNSLTDTCFPVQNTQNQAVISGRMYNSPGR